MIQRMKSTKVSKLHAERVISPKEALEFLTPRNLDEINLNPNEEIGDKLTIPLVQNNDLDDPFNRIITPDATNLRPLPRLPPPRVEYQKPKLKVKKSPKQHPRNDDCDVLYLEDGQPNKYFFVANKTELTERNLLIHHERSDYQSADCGHQLLHLHRRRRKRLPTDPPGKESTTKSKFSKLKNIPHERESKKKAASSPEDNLQITSSDLHSVAVQTSEEVEDPNKKHVIIPIEHQLVSEGTQISFIQTPSKKQIDTSMKIPGDVKNENCLTEEIKEMIKQEIKNTYARRDVDVEIEDEFPLKPEGAAMKRIKKAPKCLPDKLTSDEDSSDDRTVDESMSNLTERNLDSSKLADVPSSEQNETTKTLKEIQDSLIKLNQKIESQPEELRKEQNANIVLCYPMATILLLSVMKSCSLKLMATTLRQLTRSRGEWDKRERLMLACRLTMQGHQRITRDMLMKSFYRWQLVYPRFRPAINSPPHKSFLLSDYPLTSPATSSQGLMMPSNSTANSRQQTHFPSNGSNPQGSSLAEGSSIASAFWNPMKYLKHEQKAAPCLVSPPLDTTESFGQLHMNQRQLVRQIQEVSNVQ
eukprot:GHVH01005341.1.p1 GENE.GHVH01005341.1~~GHVH01005341.1.p1  ORF type:complete len:587 (+),score=75.61 GHVH01005341.1:1054-2814(+)